MEDGELYPWGKMQTSRTTYPSHAWSSFLLNAISAFPLMGSSLSTEVLKLHIFHVYECLSVICVLVCTVP